VVGDVVDCPVSVAWTFAMTDAFAPKDCKREMIAETWLDVRPAAEETAAEETAGAARSATAVMRPMESNRFIGIRLRY
jgi:hypothetical protein